MAVLVGPRPRRAGRAGHRRRGGGDRHPLDLLAGAVHRPRPALGPGGRDLRRGPAPDRRARRGDGARLPGRRARRPDRGPRVRQALRRLLRDPGRPGRERGRHQPAQAAVVVPAAVRAGRPRGLPHLHARLPGDGRRADHREPVAAQRRAQGGVGLHRHPRHRLGQRRPHGVGAEGLRRRRRGRGGRGPGRQRPGDDDPGLLRGGPAGRRPRAARRGRDRRGGPAGAAAQVRAGPVRGPPRPRRRSSAPR